MGYASVARVCVSGNKRSALLADLTKALLQGGRDFSIQDLQNRLNVLPGGTSAQIASEETEKVCGWTDRQKAQTLTFHDKNADICHRSCSGRWSRGLELQHQWEI